MSAPDDKVTGADENPGSMADGNSSRIFLDCTETFQFDAHTGIQRVARNLLRYGIAEGRRRGLVVQPCFFEWGHYYAAPLTADGGLRSRASSSDPDAWNRIKRAYRAVLGLLASAAPHPGLKRWLLTTSVAPGLARYVRRLLRAAYAGWPAGARQPHLTMRRGDILLTLDLALDPDIDAAWVRLKHDGVRLASVFFDLIPIRESRGPSVSFVARFQAWLKAVLRRADLVLAISGAVAADLERYIGENRNLAVCPGQVRTSFRLGNELDRLGHGGHVRESLTRAFARCGKVPVLLSVGWLELRKNHAYVLEALRILRARGVAPRWVVVGKTSPTSDGVLEQIRGCHELEGQIFVYHDLTDTELEYCYRSADAMIYPSTTEGFGLPLVEAMVRGLRVFASDIPVFREVGTEFAAFFPLDRPGELAEMLERFCDDGHFPALRPIDEFRWPDWQQCAREVFDLLALHFGRREP